MNALISVSDKTGIVEFARALHALGIRLLSTGGVNKAGGEVEYRSVEGGLLVQDSDGVLEDPAAFTVPTKRQPTDNRPSGASSPTACRTSYGQRQPASLKVASTFVV